jgi:hypothetical protein
MEYVLPNLKTYELEPQVKIKNEFAVDVNEGFFVDKNELTINGIPVTRFQASHSSLKGIVDFVNDGKPYELLFNYSWWTGNPRSFIVIQNNRVIAQYGDDSALKLKPHMTAPK